ncbi:MAG: right-handed parallel beta-helix repeat-containing protein [Kiritimatiellae bacterium]|nr:right-handed parallel beta-helix repeat-containing protein [Kiritimatiellia bacterium]
MFLVGGGIARRCEIRANRPCGGDILNGGTFENCVLADNHANGITIWNGGLVRNCTIAGNGNAGITVYADGDILIENTVLWSNVLADLYCQPGQTNYATSHCCARDVPAGVGNTTNDPVFANLAAHDYRLASGSPCIDAGTNGPVVDLEHVPRPLDGRADRPCLWDMGAYEFLRAGADTDGDGMTDGWESTHGLDLVVQDHFEDPDHDGMDNEGEYVAGTDPWDAASRFEVSGVRVQDGKPAFQFPAAPGRFYDVLYKDDLLDTNDWLALTNDLPGSAGLMEWTDPLPATQRFYKVQVRFP